MSDSNDHWGSGFLKLFNNSSLNRVKKKPNRFLALFNNEGISGRAVRTAKKIIQPCVKVFSPTQFYFCFLNLRLKEATKHLFVTGATGAGKTVLLNLFLKSISPRFKKSFGTCEQLVIFDAKMDIIPTLAGLGYRPEDERVYFLHPFDKRGAVWDIAAAVQTPALAWHLARIAIEVEQNSTAPYFTNAARLLVFAVILGLNTIKKDKWTLRDLLCALQSRENIKAVASHHAEAAVIVKSIIKDKRHAHAVISTIQTKIRDYSQVAALWATYPNPKIFSITEFLKHPGVLVIGSDPVLNESIKPFWKLLLRAMADEVLSGPETFSPRIWWIIDEFISMGKLEDSIGKLLELGRSKGAVCVLGIQSIAGMVALYGEAEANKIIGLAAHKTFLRAGDPQSAEWAERYFGKIRHVERTYSESFNKDGSSNTQQFATQDRSMFLASEFANLPYPQSGSIMRAISDVPSQKSVVITERSFDEIISWLPQRADIPAVERRTSVSDQTLWPWTKEEREVFCGKEVDEKRIKKSEPSILELPFLKPYLPARKNNNDNPDQGELF